MANPTGGDYADVKWLKNRLIIKDEDKDTELDDSIESANRFVDDVLTRHSATIPVTNAAILESCKWVANCEAMRDYKLTKQDIDMAKEWKATRKEKLDNLVAKLKSDPTANTQSKIVAVASNYKTQPMKQRNN